ncbi:EGF domain-specific O-linked N-acetylglucosamine transferase-like [Lineus longissimus]|uniref:EGF domain-specific O-linked N-acetylglucosamine transferase-like n=1 Tax=Lineus longissimus TaxID=88925 RepID=UPI00315CDCAE
MGFWTLPCRNRVRRPSINSQTAHCKTCRTYPCYITGMVVTILFTGLCMDMWQHHVWLSWIDFPNLHEDIFCGGKFVGYDHKFGLLKRVMVYPQQCARAATKEEMKLKMPWHPEYERYDGHCQLRKGFFKIDCDVPSYTFIERNGFISHLNIWMDVLTKQSEKSMQQVRNVKIENMFTIAFPRYGYTNSFCNIIELYNSYLVMSFFGTKPKDTNILLIDTLPSGSFDSVWRTLFGKVTKMSGINKATKFEKMVWGPQDYSSPMMQHEGDTLPLVENFSTFVLDQYKIPNNHNLNCNNVNVLFIWRRGSENRKIKNEGQILDTIQKKYPSFTLKGLELAPLDMKKKLQIIARTDILIGMHGADLTYSLFLPKHAGVIELYPKSWEKLKYQPLIDKYDRFEALGKWRGIVYSPWVNLDEENELENDFTVIPPETMLNLFEDTLRNICSDNVSKKIVGFT